MNIKPEQITLEELAGFIATKCGTEVGVYRRLYLLGGIGADSPPDAGDMGQSSPPTGLHLDFTPEALEERAQHIKQEAEERLKRMMEGKEVT